MGNSSKASREVVILNKLGMHARPCSHFVRLTQKAACEVWVTKDGQRVNGKSIMGLMMLASGPGSRLLISCEGAGAEETLAAIEQLVAAKFHEE